MKKKWKTKMKIIKLIENLKQGLNLKERSKNKKRRKSKEN
jgi:hypothetical protein